MRTEQRLKAVLFWASHVIHNEAWQPRRERKWALFMATGGTVVRRVVDEPKMTITDYLDEIEYAATQVIASLWHEHKEAEALRNEIDALKKTAEANYSRAISMQQNAESNDDLMQGVGMYWDTYFGEDRDQHYKSLDLKALTDRLSTREFSFASLAGTLLQFAKQGLSVVYGSPTNWPPSRKIGSQPLMTVILQARNQSEHWEEGNPRPSVEACFQTLEAEKDNQFSQYRTKNLAFDVVSMLGWNTYADFKNDMLTIQPNDV